MASRHAAIVLVCMIAPAACANILGFEEGILVLDGSLPPGVDPASTLPGHGGSPAGTAAAGGWTAPSNTAGSAPCLSDAPNSSGCHLHPPPYINVDVCASIVDDGVNTRLTECIGCCQQNGGYGQSSFIHNKQCTCGSLPTVRDTVTCADQFADNATCRTCCQGVGYGQWSYTSALCTCNGQLDNPTICAATASMAIPVEACPNCCINNGYLGVSYFALNRTCTCTG
jgi:hypothetical protein